MGTAVAAYRECRFCLNLFAPSRRNQVYCSTQCQKLYHYAREGRKMSCPRHLLAELAGAAVGLAEGLLAEARAGRVPDRKSMDHAAWRLAEMKRWAANLGLIADEA